MTINAQIIFWCFVSFVAVSLRRNLQSIANAVADLKNNSDRETVIAILRVVRAVCVTYLSFLCVSDSHCYSQDEYDQMSLRTWVNVVCGKMTAIDRFTQCLTYSN